MSQKHGVLILGDMFGGTASSVAIKLGDTFQVEVLTGVNLPMLLKLPSALEEAEDLAALTQLLKAYGRRHIRSPRRESEGPNPSDPPASDAEPFVAEEESVEAIFEVVNERGLHLRAAHVLAHLATECADSIRIGRLGQDVLSRARTGSPIAPGLGQDVLSRARTGSPIAPGLGHMVNAKSLLGLTTLGATRGDQLRVVVAGKTCRATLERIRALFAAGFREGPAPAP